jgi:site-specific DNA recombinase
MAIAAAIYCRISGDDADDDTHKGAGVARQEEGFRALCKRRGWTVAEVIADNDISALSGHHRPGYTRLLHLMESGQVGAVVAYAPERLHRARRNSNTSLILLSGQTCGSKP